jgi:hypothetical protein
VAPKPYPTIFSELRHRYSPTRVILQKGLREGVFGGRKGWLVAFVVFRGLLGARHALSRKDEFITIDRLKPGERILVRTIPVHSAKERKQLLRGR